ncbi:hypothetical protein [Chitinophaga sp. RAB17]|uniref:hypothetical protein n=1 Tax=Chitinophaga sp. RAB17 TaxID=3233049 RepID=UPI003F936363
MKKITLFFFFCFGVLATIQAQIQAPTYDTVHFKKGYINDIFSSLYSANFRSGFIFQTNASMNYALNGPSGNGFRFRWLANDTLVDHTTDRDLIMTLLPKGDMILKNSLNVPNLTVGSVSDTSYKKLVIAGANIPTNIGSKRDISYEFAAAGKAIIRSYRGNSWDTYLQLLTSNTSNTGGEPAVRMHINQDGNIGLGNTNPFDHLNITGTIGTVPNRIAIQNTGIPNSLFYVGNTSSDYTVTNQRSTNILESYTDLHVGAANSGNIYFETGRVGTTAPVRMTILNDGTVGIGTNTTGTNKLAVEGTIAARRVKVTSADPWPDYVFNDSYQLPLLPDLATYIAKNSHLPGIPDATEIARDGQDLGEMNRKLLEKVEELTLYIIQLDKRNNQQQAQIDTLIKQMNK